MQEVYIGVDCGGTNIRAACGNKNGEIITQLSTASYSDQYGKSPVERIIGIIESIIDRINPEKEMVKAIGIGVPGAYYQGKIYFCTNLEEVKVEEIRAFFHHKYSLSVSIMNDVKCAALGEQWLGEETDNFIYINIGTGLGLALICNGRLYMGENNASGEIGYWISDPAMQSGYKSGLAPLSSIISGAGLKKRFVELYKGKSQSLTDWPNSFAEIDAKALFDLYKKGFKPVVSFIDESLSYMKTCIANICILLNPKTVILGGGLSHDFDVFEQAISEYMKEMVPFPPILVKSTLGMNSGLYGAIRLAMMDHSKKQCHFERI
jgi:glucokinase